MLYLQTAPGPPLDASVASIWIFRQDPQPLALERVLPTGAAQLIINLKEDETRLYDPDHHSSCDTTVGTVLAGAASRYQIIDTAEQEYVAGVSFRPGGTVPFMPVPACETAGVDVPLADLRGRSLAEALRERLLGAPTPEAALLELEAALRELWTPRCLHPAVAFALGAFDREPRAASIAAVTDAVGLSAKRFIERFKIDVGLTPKRYCRVRRFQQAVSRAHRGREIDWAEVAVDCGYFDQAHFIHDFRAFAGVTPTAYQAGRTPFSNHVKFLQSSSGVALAR